MTLGYNPLPLLSNRQLFSFENFFSPPSGAAHKAQPPATAASAPATTSPTTRHPHPPLQPPSPHLPPNHIRLRLPGEAMPVTNSQRKGLPKGRMKEPLEFHLGRQTRNSREKQLEDEELLFEEQSEEVEEGADGRESKFDGEGELSTADFSTPKGQPANSLRNKTKSNAGVTNTPTNATRRNTRKRPVEDTFPSPTPGPTKAARRSQQPTMGDGFQAIQNEGKLLGFLKTQAEEIQELKELLYAQEKELAELKTMIKSIAKDVSSTKDTSKKAESMASHLASLHCSDRQASPEIIPNPVSLPSPPKSVSKDPQIVLDLSLCEPELIQKPFSEIRQVLHTSITESAGTEGIKVKGMNKDARKEHRYFVFFNTLEDETKARVHNKWVSTHFPKARMQPPISFPVKGNRARATAILDAATGKVAVNAKDVISDSNGGLKITRIGWLSKVGTGKLYGSLVIYLANKDEAETLLEKGVVEIGGETAYAETWQEVGPEEKRCFNCQEYGHKAGVCVKILVCGNCSMPGHSHRQCMNTQVNCPNCGGNHPANSHRCARRSS